MRIRLKKGKQKELILQAKKNLTWKELSKILQVSQPYLCNCMKKERVLISDKIYNNLCRITNKNLDEFIIEKLNDNWGRSKGGNNSKGNTIELKKIPKFDERLAEIIGILLGDGNINAYKKGKKVAVYHIKIAGDLEKDKIYHIKYIKPLLKEVFELEPKEMFSKKSNGRYVVLYGKKVVEFFNEMGIKPGNKIMNQSTIPSWVYQKDSYIKSCLRGLIDTDGSVFRMSNQDKNLIRISFKNHNKTLLKDARDLFIKVGFNPSKIIRGNVFYLSRQAEIKKYLKDIGFSNDKHIRRLKEFTAPSSSGQFYQK